MRDIGTKELGVAVLAVAMLQWACDGGGVAGPSAVPSSLPAPSFQARSSLSGTWRGGDTTMGLVWQLNQDGERIKGSSRIFGEEWTTDEGSVVGTVAGSSFTFSESHAAGTVTGCTAQLQGTLTFKSVSDRPQNPPSRYWQNAPEPPQPRESLTGRISGHACDGPVDVVVVLFRD